MEGARQKVGEVYVTPYGGDALREFQLHPAEVRVTERPDGILEVHDPAHFDEPFRIGDRSTFEHPTVDSFARLVWDHYAFHGSTRQLGTTEMFETKEGASRWSNLQHMLTTAALTAHFGGSPRQIMQAAVHDLAHMIRRHSTESLIQDRGLEDHHDQVLRSFVERTGFLSLLEQRSLVRDGVFTELDMPVDWVFDPSRIPQDFTNQPGREGFMEVDRFYNNSEQAFWGYGPAAARQIREDFIRIPDSPHGDHLVARSYDTAGELCIGQTRNRTENWNDRTHEVTRELFNIALRYAMTMTTEEAKEYNQYFPGDVLYGLEEDLQEQLLHMGEKDQAVFIGVMLKLARLLSEQQREVQAAYDKDKNVYAGPVFPDWIREGSTLFIPSTSQRIRVEGRQKHGAEYLILDMQPGKVRWLNVWVKLAGRDMERIEDAKPSVRQFREQQTRWCRDSYRAVIDLCHPKVDLSLADRKAIQKGVGTIQEAWHTQAQGHILTSGASVLDRPPMPDEVLQTRIQAHNERYREIGRLSFIQARIPKEATLAS